MHKKQIDLFLKDIRTLSSQPNQARHKPVALYDYPFDLQLLTLSSVYRESRKQYLALGGRFSPRIASTMRSLSAQDLFADDIDYTPAATELEWFATHRHDVYSPADEIAALAHFNVISVYHEQNHRILWRLLPPPPADQHAFRRYLNFAESLVVMLDLALADQVGPKLSPAFERMKVIYRSGSVSKKWQSSRDVYRDYLVATQFATYLILELIDADDIPKAMDYVRPGQKQVNRDAIKRAFDISELFTRVTNPQWQERYGKVAQRSLTKLHQKSNEPPLLLPNDPLDFDDEFTIAHRILKQFNL